MKTAIYLLIILTLALAAGTIDADAHPLNTWDSYKSRVAFTGSMRPFLKGGEVVTILRVPYTFLREGMVVTYHNPVLNSKSDVIHRIVKRCVVRGKVVFIVAGDANPPRMGRRSNSNQDPGYLTEENYVGVLIEITPAKGS